LLGIEFVLRAVPIGGGTRFVGAWTRGDRVRIYLGGVVANLAVAVPLLLLRSSVPWPVAWFAIVNAGTVFTNLVPVAPLLPKIRGSDGWYLGSLLFRRTPGRLQPTLIGPGTAPDPAGTLAWDLAVRNQAPAIADAERWVELALERGPDDPRLLATLALVRVRQQRYSEAETGGPVRPRCAAGRCR
jgi:hypothetical protein